MLSGLLRTIYEMLFAVLFAVLSALSSLMVCCSCLYSYGCVSFDTNNYYYSDDSKSKCFSNARLSISFMSLMREATYSIEKPGISKNIATDLFKESL